MNYETMEFEYDSIQKAYYSEGKIQVMYSDKHNMWVVNGYGYGPTICRILNYISGNNHTHYEWEDISEGEHTDSEFNDKTGYFLSGDTWRDLVAEQE